jgi:hypothetical protein
MADILVKIPVLENFKVILESNRNNLKKKNIQNKT